ncbi:hypothetical protein BpHYR1_017742 [Brachionus plicatilis]|uniref:Uncharacterized protein n=1 Tax=Brachionus plicatilis TaxID=10195 RepID=A0A3M7S6H2_BRAPC|nr:hypothetical protein BpHYR1_017742 [Brachionus plicatilis]
MRLMDKLRNKKFRSQFFKEFRCPFSQKWWCTLNFYYLSISQAPCNAGLNKANDKSLLGKQGSRMEYGKNKSSGLSSGRGFKNSKNGQILILINYSVDRFTAGI